MKAGAVSADADRADADRADADRADADRADANRDVAVVCGVTDDGRGLEIIRKRGEQLEAGTVRKLEHGKPIHGEVVRLRPREHQPLVCDVEVQVAGSKQLPLDTLSGPPQVATESYRKNWDAIYGRPRKGRDLPN